MYLDDGVSRSSAPKAVKTADIDIDPLANSEYREVHIKQETIASGLTRTVTMTIPHDDYGTDKVKGDIGPVFTFVFWDEPGAPPNPTVEGATSHTYLQEIGATTAVVPVDLAPGKELVVKLTYK